MRTSWLIEKKEIGVLGANWEKGYESNHQDWAEKEFESRISDYSEEAEYKLVKREVLALFNPD